MEALLQSDIVVFWMSPDQSATFKDSPYIPYHLGVSLYRQAYLFFVHSNRDRVIENALPLSFFTH